jgi:cell division protein FtsL
MNNVTRNIGLFILMTLLLVSCKPRYTENKIILRAESLLFSSPDSSYQLLTSIPHPEKLSKADYAAWCLHFTHAQVKLHNEIKSDSLIMVSVNYYKNSRLLKYCGTAYYLEGCILRQNNNNKAAILAFKLAEDELKETNENKIKGLVEFNIGYICMQDELYNHSLNYFKKSLRYFGLSNEKKYRAYAYREMSNMYNQLNYPFDSVMFYSNQALRLSKESNDSLNYFCILSQQGKLLYDKNPARSKECILKSYRYFPYEQPTLASFLAYTYSKLNKPDSAAYYLRISLADTARTSSQEIIYLADGYIAESQHNYEKAFYNLEKAYLVRDSLFQQKIRSQLYRIDKQYDLSKKEKENFELKLANQRKIIWIALLLVVVLIVLTVLLLINNRHKKKQAAHETEKQRMEFEIRSRKGENEQNRKLLLSKLQNKIENTLRFNRLKMGLKQQDKFDAFMNEITRQSTISEEEWHYYNKEVDSIFDKKIYNLSVKYSGLTQSDIRVVLLICLRLDIADSCSLLNVNKNTIYHRRKLIKERIGMDKDSDLEEWIIQYIENENSETTPNIEVVTSK